MWSTDPFFVWKVHGFDLKGDPLKNLLGDKSTQRMI